MPIETPAVVTGPGRPTARLLVWFLVVNLGIFLACRAAFLALFVDRVSAGEVARVLLYGARLDVGLIGLEAVILLLVSIVVFGVRLRLLWGTAAALTLLNALVAVVDLSFYAERNQHMGELLLTNITDLDHIRAELASFVSTSPLTAVGAGVGLLAVIWLGSRLIRRVAPLCWSFRRPLPGFLVLFPGVPLLGLLALEPVQNKAESGYEIDWVNAMHYSRLGRLTLHEAVANPLQEILVVHLPLSFAEVPPPFLAPAQSLALCRDALGLQGGDVDFPLLREIEGRADLGIENVIVIQVEGLTGSILDQRADRHWVTPFLREMGERGLYFPNTLHSYGNTAGGVFATVTGMPRTSIGEMHHRVFTRQEARVSYSSLPRCLGVDATGAWFFEGFRQSHTHYRAFAGNQGFHALTYPDLHDVLVERGREGRDETVLGIHDGALFEIAIERVLAGPRPFVAHVVTANTHFPWPVPEGFESPIENKRLRTFRYLDTCVRDLVGRLAEDEETYRKTLVVVLADHTNITFGEDPMERLRIPLILFSPALEAAGLQGRRETLASQADVLPTCLGLVAGRHRYAGIGRDLLDPERSDGVLVTSRNGSLYFKGGFAFRWQIRPAEEVLHRFEDGRLGTEDVAASHPDAYATLRRESHAIYETSRRLAQERRIFPPER